MEQRKYYAPIFIISGPIIHGRGIGKLLGTPTANLKITDRQALPPEGIYIAIASLKGKVYYGITHIGPRPTISNDKEICVETHLLNFYTDIYGLEMEIRLIKKLRTPQRFDNLTLLLEQIHMDCIAVQEFFGIRQVDSRLYMDVQKHKTLIDGQILYLSLKEFDVLYLLYSNPDVAFTKEQIYEAVWHQPANGHFHAVENTVFQIRKKTTGFENGLDFIKTVTGYGYTFNPVTEKAKCSKPTSSMPLLR